MKTTLLAGLALAAVGAMAASAQDIKIAQVHDKTGALEAYAKQSNVGLMLGLEYATGGTMMINGRKLVVIEKDTQLKPDVGKAMLTEAFADDDAVIAVGPTSSGTALAMLPVAQQHQKILLVEPAVADSITGANWNRYIFRTGRNSAQDAISNAVALGGKDVAIATLAQDYAFGKDGVAAFKEALGPTGAKLVHEEYAPLNTTDFTAPGQRILDALKNVQAKRKFVFIIWAGAGNPLGGMKALAPDRFGVEIATGGNIIAALKAYKDFPGMEGATYYYYAIPKNPANDWLVAEHTKRYNEPPDFFTAGGMAAGIAIVTAIKKAGGTDTEKLIAAMEGMEFDSPKGKMMFRKEDHQALQSMYHFKIKSDPNVAWGIPELVRELKIEDMNVPIRNKR